MCEQQSVDIAVLMSRLSSLINPPDMIRIALAWLHRLHTLQPEGMWTVGAFIFLSFLSIENQTKCICGILVWEWKVNLLILTRVINLINLSFCAAFNQTSSNPFNTFPSNIYAEASTTLQQVAEKKIDSSVITSVAVSAKASQWWIIWNTTKGNKSVVSISYLVCIKLTVSGVGSNMNYEVYPRSTALVCWWLVVTHEMFVT